MPVTREQILDVAVRTFAECGYHGATLATVGERLGISKSAVLYHFSSKDELLDEVLAPMVDDITALVQAWQPPIVARSQRLAFLAELMTLQLSHLAACQVLHNDRTMWERGTAGAQMANNYGREVELLAGPEPSHLSRTRAHTALAIAFRATTSGLDMRGPIPSVDSPEGAEAMQILTCILGE